MPSAREHLEREASDARLFDDLVRRRQHPDWAITVLFYRALHLVEAAFAERGVHHLAHYARAQAVIREMPEVADEYGELYALSRDARYGPLGLFGWDTVDEALGAFGRIEAGLRREG